MKLKYGPCLWNPNAAHHFPGCLPDTEIEVEGENSLRVDGVDYEFPVDGVSCPDIREQTGGVIEEAHRDADGALCATVRRFFTSPGGELAWYSEDYVEVPPCAS